MCVKNFPLTIVGFSEISPSKGPFLFFVFFFNRKKGRRGVFRKEIVSDFHLVS